MSSEGPAPDSYAGTDNLEVMAEARKYNAFLASLVGQYLDRNGLCLDFGAGIGTFAEAIRDSGFRVEALDTEIVHREAIQARGIQALASLDEIPDATYMNVFTFNVLEHIDDDMSVLQELNRVLAPGGTLLVYVPALPWLFTAMDRKVGHVRRYRLPELVSKLEAAGFQVDEARYADSLGVLATLAYKGVGNKSGDLNPATIKVYDRWGFPVSRALDRLFSKVGGKNVYTVATKK